MKESILTWIRVSSFIGIGIVGTLAILERKGIYIDPKAWLLIYLKDTFHLEDPYHRIPSIGDEDQGQYKANYHKSHPTRIVLDSSLPSITGATTAQDEAKSILPERLFKMGRLLRPMKDKSVPEEIMTAATALPRKRLHREDIESQLK